MSGGEKRCQDRGLGVLLAAVIGAAAVESAQKDGAENGVATASAPDRTALTERGSG